MQQISIQMYLTLSIGLSHMKSPTGFLQSPPPPIPTPLTINWRFPTFHYRSFSFCCLPNFSSLESYESPLKVTQDFSRSWKASSHMCYFSTLNKIPFFKIAPFSPHLGTPLNVHTVSIDPDVLSQAKLGLQWIIYKEILLSMVTPFLSIWTSQKKSPKVVHPILMAHHPLPSLGTSPGDTWTQSLITSFLSFNPQYESGKQGRQGKHVWLLPSCFVFWGFLACSMGIASFICSNLPCFSWW